jgi:hypothetical protein
VSPIEERHPRVDEIAQAIRMGAVAVTARDTAGWPLPVTDVRVEGDALLVVVQNRSRS